MTQAPTEYPADPEGYQLKKPIYKRVWFWLLAIILLIILISAVSGGGNDPSVGSDAAEDVANTPAGSTCSGPLHSSGYLWPMRVMDTLSIHI